LVLTGLVVAGFIAFIIWMGQVSSDWYAFRNECFAKGGYTMSEGPFGTQQKCYGATGGHGVIVVRQ
jgi:hypothetical protein